MVGLENHGHLLGRIGLRFIAPSGQSAKREEIAIEKNGIESTRPIRRLIYMMTAGGARGLITDKDLKKMTSTDRLILSS
jgi:hypothetical protein